LFQPQVDAFDQSCQQGSENTLLKLFDQLDSVHPRHVVVDYDARASGKLRVRQERGPLS
jgi:hypothetical protein